jgi:hypothetical protein
MNSNNIYKSDSLIDLEPQMNKRFPFNFFLPLVAYRRYNFTILADNIDEAKHKLALVLQNENITIDEFLDRLLEDHFNDNISDVFECDDADILDDMMEISLQDIFRLKDNRYQYELFARGDRGVFPYTNPELFNLEFSKEEMENFNDVTIEIKDGKIFSIKSENESINYNIVNHDDPSKNTYGITYFNNFTIYKKKDQHLNESFNDSVIFVEA